MNTIYIIMAVSVWILYNTVWQTIKEAWKESRKAGKE
jgi:hypothetical protein